MISNEIKENFYKTLDEMEKPDSAFLAVDIDSQDFVLEMKYPRSRFISDIKKTISQYDISKQTDITSFYGFVIEECEDFDTIKGYPSIENLSKEDSMNSAKVYHYVKNFTEENEAIVQNNPVISKYLNSIIKALPEFLTLIGKVQHHTHSYCVAVHTLKVLQGVMKNPHYFSLPKEDRRVLQLAVLMHDVTKKEGVIDKTHPVCASKDAAFIFNKFDLSKSEKEKICSIIRNHDWLERYNKGITSAKEFAQTFKNGNDFLMLCILAEADLKAVQRDNGFYEKYKDVLFAGEKEIKALINKAQTAA